MQGRARPFLTEARGARDSVLTFLPTARDYGYHAWEDTGGKLRWLAINRGGRGCVTLIWQKRLCRCNKVTDFEIGFI